MLDGNEQLPDWIKATLAKGSIHPILNTFDENEQLRSLDVSNVKILMIVYVWNQNLQAHTGFLW